MGPVGLGAPGSRQFRLLRGDNLKLDQSHGAICALRNTGIMIMAGRVRLRPGFLTALVALSPLVESPAPSL